MRVSERRTAVFFMILSSASFALMGACVKLAGDLPLFMKVFVRNLMILILVLITSGRDPGLLKGRRENLPPLLLRAFFGLAAVILYFFSIYHLPLADSSMLNKLSPFFVTLFAGFFLREKVSAYNWPIMAAAFLGALMIIKPGFNLSILPSAAGLLSAVLAGAAYTLVRYLGVNGEKPATIIFYFSVISFAATLPLAVLTFRDAGTGGYLLLALTGLFAAGGQFFMTTAYSLAPANEISIYNYFNVLFSAFLGFLFWGERPDLLSAIGGVLIVISAYMMFSLTKEAV